MKFPVTLLLSAAAILVLGACGKHSFEETKVLHEKFQEHGPDEHAAPAHGEKSPHGAEADNGEKKAH